MDKKQKSFLDKALDSPFRMPDNWPLKYIPPPPNKSAKDKKEPLVTIKPQEVESSSIQEFVNPQKIEPLDPPKTLKEYEPAIAGMESGYIKVWRKTMDNPIYPKNRRFTEFEAWIDLCLRANGKDKEILFDRKPLLVKRGQFVTSIQKLAERWGWTRKETRCYLNRACSRAHSITKISDHRKTIITLINYDVYNPSNKEKHCPGAQSRAQKGHGLDPTLDPQLMKEKNVKKGKDKYLPQTPQDDDTQELFECFWENYPRKVEKKVALGAFGELKKREQVLTIKCVINYRVHCRATKTEERYIKHPATFLRKDRWKDWLEKKSEKELDPLKASEKKLREDQEKIKKFEQEIKR